MKPLAENRRARFDYAIFETYEAGIELLGTEVKSVKTGHLNLAGSYVVIRSPRHGPGRSAGGREAWLLNAEIPAYQPLNAPRDYNPKRSRRLLLHKQELRTLTGKLHEKGLTLLPLRAYEKKKFIKVEIGVGKAKKTRDKRESLKKKSAEREMRKLK